MQNHDEIDDTHDPARTSWVAGSAAGTDFPVQNLPLCTFLADGAPRVGVGIGEAVLDLMQAGARGLFDSELGDALHAATDGLGSLMAWPPGLHRRLRRQLSELLTTGAPAAACVADCLRPRDAVHMQLPARPGNFTDFFASVHHARNAGELRRPGNPLLPNFHHLPVAYNGRASSVRVSGVPVRRPLGQIQPEGAAAPHFAPTAWLDFECELAVWLGCGTELGERVPLAQAASHVFGIGLLNDWSARDIQLWESQPLGPLLSKSFQTTVSPWVVTAGALAPFRVPAAPREAGAPPLLPHLDHPDDRRHGGLAVALTVAVQSAAMRARNLPPHVIARPHFKDHYWTPGQMLTHLTSNGCNLSPGDLVGSGTVSGPARDQWGCLLEFTRLGREPFELPGGETRVWLQDGDEVVIGGACNAPGFVPIGLGEARARIAPATHFS